MGIKKWKINLIKKLFATGKFKIKNDKIYTKKEKKKNFIIENL